MADRPTLAGGAGRRWPLAWLLGASLVLHLALIGLVPMPQGDGAGSLLPHLQVRLAPSGRPVAVLEPQRVTVDAAPSRGTATVPRSALQQDPALAPRVSFTPSAPPAVAAPSAAALMDSARQMARTEAIRLDPPRGNVPSPEDGKPSPEAVVAAMAARSRIQPEETRLADGTLRVVNQWGVRYCTKAPPDFQRSGPVGHDAVVTNCL